MKLSSVVAFAYATGFAFAKKPNPRYDHRHHESGSALSKAHDGEARNLFDERKKADLEHRHALLNINVTDYFCPYPHTYDFECPDDYENTKCGDGEMSCYYSNMCWAKESGFWEGKCEVVCPKPEDVAAATCSEAEWAPVACTEEYCQYDNKCLAEAAGFDFEKECYPITCPYKSSEECYSVEWVNIKCTGGPHDSEDKCYFSSFCEAQASGFAIGECSETCPSGDGDLSCDDTFAPVTCGGDDWCEYRNLCKAKAAGFVNEGDCVPTTCPYNYEAQCSSKPKYVKCGEDECIYSNYCYAKKSGVFDKPMEQCTRVCPNPLKGSTEAKPICPYDEYTPVSCGNQGCQYASKCMAKAAGFSEDECWDMDWCPYNSYSWCTPTNEPYTCGEGACYFDSLCAANEVGFDVKDCEPVPYEEPTCPYETYTDECETATYKPVYCGGEDYCWYQNLCAAVATGKFAESDCEVIVTIPPIECPYSELNGECGDEPYKPYMCGEGGYCWYDSLCAAKVQGGFAETECTEYDYDGYETIAPSGCYAEPEKALICGPDDMWFFNQCDATKSGFSEADCDPAACPKQPKQSDSTCEKWDSVRCGHRSYYDCFYANECDAKAVGFDPDTECIDSPL